MDYSMNNNRDPSPESPPDFPDAFLDSLTDSIAVLDSEGFIVDTNQAWRDFARRNGFYDGTTIPGDSYIEVANRAGKVINEQAVNGLESVLEGEWSEFEHEYSSHSCENPRWSKMQVSSFELDGQDYPTVDHTNITDSIEN